MYLDVADSATLPYGWSRYSQFSLAVVNQMHNKLTVKKGISKKQSCFFSYIWLKLIHVFAILSHRLVVFCYYFFNGPFLILDDPVTAPKHLVYVCLGLKGD